MQKLFFASITATLICSAHAQSITRDELKRADLTGKEMDVIVTVPPGGSLPNPTGAATINIQDIPHAGFKATKH